ncbi:MAG: NAD(P)/FAD-dependent oxidoreductase [Candidatus Electronema sp. V4]|uniref:NAD(P)/FAD-dependent oxidoreductase n=1 Tax=Candidatus Electronema sp. V4 TaxID=3454756 RepID=UPI0040555F9D
MSSISTDILIIGAGPAGLACAKILAEQGRKVLVLERRQEIGPKVCAGGITWDGLLRLVPEELIEGCFREQHIFTPCQQTVVREPEPIIATISRRTLGQWMAKQAAEAGAEIITETKVTALDGLRVTAVSGGISKTFTCSHLVGADGANSLVRRSLGLPAEERGTGINFQVPQQIYERMEWHLSARAFGCGYAWIFPHKDSVSVGAYSPQADMSAGRLKRNFLKWAAGRGFQLDELACQAALVNYDYRGYSFGPVWLAGDAAGLASGLTGEGIYPAVISGETVARRILDPNSDQSGLNAVLRRQAQHRRVISLSARHPSCSFVLMELLLLLLRWKLISFHALEMAPSSPKQ